MNIYDEARSKLLILGDPGSGKTTLLLHLAQTLLTRAATNEMNSLPIVLPLSSGKWQGDTSSLFKNWLIQELVKRYDVPSMMAQYWVTSHKLILLLDGLDEVSKLERLTCIQAIQEYRQDKKSVRATDLVLCCRNNEYEELTIELPLNTAITILPLSEEQVHSHVSGYQGQLDGLLMLIQSDAEFAKLSRRPLFLNIATLAFKDRRSISLPRQDNFPSESNLASDTSQKALSQILFTTFVNKMLSRRKTLPDQIKPQVFIFWLSFIAKKLQQENQTEFTTSSLIPSWLPEAAYNRYHWCYFFISILLFSLVFGSFSALINYLFLPTFFKLSNLLLTMFIGNSDPSIVIPSNDSLFGSLFIGYIYGWFINLVLWIDLGEDIGKRYMRDYKYTNVKLLVTSIIIGQFIGSLVALGNTRGIELFIGLIIGFGFGMYFGTNIFKVFGYSLFMALCFIILWPLILIPTWVLHTIIPNYLDDPMQETISKFQWISWFINILFKNGIINVFIFLVSFVLLSAIVFIIVAFIETFLSTFLLHFLLWRSHLLPWKLNAFLQEATDRLLLMKAGNRFFFVHRLLLDYFAMLEVDVSGHPIDPE